MVRRQHGNSQEHVTKHIFVTGGVVSSLGKGLTASSLGRLLRSRGIKVLQQKLDPYINVDSGHDGILSSTVRSMSPKMARKPISTSATTSVSSTCT